MSDNNDPLGVFLGRVRCAESVVIEIVGSDRVVRLLVDHLAGLSGILFIGAEEKEDNRYKLGGVRKFVARAVIPMDIFDK